MALSSKLFPVLLLLLLLLAAEMGPLQEAMAGVCTRRCQKCTGFCFDDGTGMCFITCRNEGYDTGMCFGNDHHCRCSKNC